MKTGLFLMLLGAAMIFTAVEYGMGDYNEYLQLFGAISFGLGILSVLLGQFRRR